MVTDNKVNISLKFLKDEKRTFWERSSQWKMLLCYSNRCPGRRSRVVSPLYPRAFQPHVDNMWKSHGCPSVFFLRNLGLAWLRMNETKWHTNTKNDIKNNIQKAESQEDSSFPEDDHQAIIAKVDDKQKFCTGIYTINDVRWKSNIVYCINHAGNKPYNKTYWKRTLSPMQCTWANSAGLHRSGSYSLSLIQDFLWTHVIIKNNRCFNTLHVI